jgi:eukaryotic-like serine/threonine-protein kinase
LVQACLQKDPQQRLQAIGDMRLLLGDDIAAPEPVIIEVKPKLPWLWPAVAALFAIAAGVMTWMWRTAPPPELQSAQFPLSPPPDERFTNAAGGFAASPDGRYVIFPTAGKGQTSLWLRPIDSMVARPLPGTSLGNFPFWSPDSKSIVFTAQQKLKRLEITGGAPLELADVVTGDNSVTSTGTWNEDGVILFGSAEGLRRTSASGGGATPLTKTDPKQKETGHGFPQFLPDGNRFLYVAASDDPNIQGVYVSSLDAPEQRKLIVRTNAKAVYIPPKGSAPGYLLWMQESNLVAQRFNLDKLEREGDPVSVAESISRAAPAPIRAAYWASDAGLLVYVSGGDVGAKRRIVWMSRDGKLVGDALPEGNLTGPALSPDGTRLAVTRTEGGQSSDIGVWEFARSVSTRLTFEKEAEALPVWSPDSRYIAYLVAGKGIYRKDASGAGQPELLLQEASQAEPMDWSRDGKFLLYRIANGTTGRDLWAVPLADAKPAGKPFAVVARQFDQSGARFSPNGKWISFSSTENGQQEVFIQPFVPPTANGGAAQNPEIRWQVSNAGAGDTAWREDGKELYFESLNGDIMAAAIREEGQGLKVDAPRLLFKAGSDRGSTHSFDANRDGQKFVIQLPPAAATGDTALTVVTNWQSALRK